VPIRALFTTKKTRLGGFGYGQIGFGVALPHTFGFTARQQVGDTEWSWAYVLRVFCHIWRTIPRCQPRTTSRRPNPDPTGT